MEYFEEKQEHESYGMICVSKFTANHCEFFGSDIQQGGGISITISRGDKKRGLSSEWFHSGVELIRVDMSHNQFVDAITSGMNTQGVPCTIKGLAGKSVPQISHVEDKKEQFSGEMKDHQDKYKDRIDEIIKMTEGNIGKRKAAEIKHELEVLRSHISSNENFVLKQFDRAMDKSVTEAKQAISGYIDNKIHTLGIEAMRDQLQISIGQDKEVLNTKSEKNG